MMTSFRKAGLSFVPFILTGCSRAPSFDVLGSFFPAWLFCLLLGLLLMVATRQLILRARVVVAVPILTYPSLTALFTFALWLAFFR
jgi:YtcA family